MRRDLPVIRFPEEWIVPFEVIVSGRLGASAQIETALEVAARNAASLSEYGVFFWRTSFERRDKKQGYKESSSVVLSQSKEGVKLDFIYKGDVVGFVENIALEAKQVMAGAGIVGVEKITMSWWSVNCALGKIDNDAVKLLIMLVRCLGSGKVFEHYWQACIMGSDEEKVKKHGFELYRRVARSGLVADEVNIVFKLQLLDLRGLDVVRQLCEGEVFYTTPLGTFRNGNKKAILGIFTNIEGHRLSLTLKEAPSEEEWRHLESLLGTRFNRKPFA